MEGGEKMTEFIDAKTARAELFFGCSMDRWNNIKKMDGFPPAYSTGGRSKDVWKTIELINFRETRMRGAA